MRFIKEWGKGIKNFISSNSVIVYLFFGVILVIVSFIWIDEKNIWFKITNTLGTTLLAGGVFASIAKSSQFTDIFSKILRDIIFGSEHLESRKDLEKIWENVTHTLSNKKFLKISDQMKDNVKKYFLPLNHDYYYDNYRTEIVIEIDSKNEDYIKIKETVSYDIISEDENLEILISSKRGMKFDLKCKELTKYTLNKLTIDNKPSNINVNYSYDKNLYWAGFEFKLKGQKKYSIRREEEVSYNIKYDQLKQHLANWVYNGFHVSIYYPNNVYIDFNSMGTLNDFNISSKKMDMFKKIEADYKGLIYKNQGFFLQICKKL